MSNVTTAPRAQPQFNGSLINHFPHAVAASYIGYGLLGFITLTVNVLVVCTILSRSSLRRREMYPLVALAIGDGTFGAAFVTAFFRRGYLILEGTALKLVTPWYCMTVVHSYLFLAGAIHATLMLVVVSADRFIAVAYPLFYYNLTSCHSVVVLLLPWLYAQFLFIVGLCISWYLPDSPTERMLCYSESGVSAGFYFAFTIQLQTFAVVSVVVYAVVMIVFRRRAKSISDALLAYHIRRQAKLTKMLSIIALCTTLLFIIPSYVNASKESLFPNHKTIVVPITSALQICNSTVNFFVYLGYNRNFREAFVALCTGNCTKLSDAINDRTTLFSPTSTPRVSRDAATGHFMTTMASKDSIDAYQRRATVV